MREFIAGGTATVALLLISSVLPACGADAAEPFRTQVTYEVETDIGGRDSVTAGPGVVFSYEETSADGPVREALFLSRVPWVSVGLKEHGGEDTGKGISFDTIVRWASGDLPWTVTVPFGYSRRKWGDNDRILSYWTLGVDGGYYLAESAEVAVFWSYAQPDLFTDNGPSYDYLAWDLHQFGVRGKASLDLGSGRHLVIAPEFNHVVDQQNNSLASVGIEADLYLTPLMSVGLVLSSSSFSGGGNAWSNHLEAMGGTQFGVRASYDFETVLGVSASITSVTPEDSSYDEGTVFRISVTARK